MYDLRLGGHQIPFRKNTCFYSISQKFREHLHGVPVLPGHIDSRAGESPPGKGEGGLPGAEHQLPRAILVDGDG